MPSVLIALTILHCMEGIASHLAALGRIEAVACGVVPVRTPTEGAADQIDDGINGFLFPVGDDAALADRLRWLMDHPDERLEMGKRAMAKAREHFSDEVMARKTIAVYEELLG